MAAKAGNTSPLSKLFDTAAYPVLAATNIYKGTPTFVKNATGYAFTNDGTTNTLANGDVFVGISADQADNSAGASAALDVLCIRTTQVVELTFSDSLTGADVGASVFVNNVSDDAVVTKTSDTGNPQATIGKVSQVTGANTAFVEITPLFTVANGA